MTTLCKNSDTEMAVDTSRDEKAAKGVWDARFAAMDAASQERVRFWMSQYKVETVCDLVRESGRAADMNYGTRYAPKHLVDQGGGDWVANGCKTLEETQRDRADYQARVEAEKNAQAATAKTVAEWRTTQTLDTTHMFRFSTRRWNGMAAVSCTGCGGSMAGQTVKCVEHNGPEVFCDRNPMKLRTQLGWWHHDCAVKGLNGCADMAKAMGDQKDAVFFRTFPTLVETSVETLVSKAA